MTPRLTLAAPARNTWRPRAGPRRPRRASAVLGAYRRHRPASWRKRRASIPARPSSSARSAATAGGRSSLHSDVDLLIALRAGDRGAEERFVNALLQPLWDIGLSVGHHVRELDEFDEPDMSNTEFLLSLLDLRLIAGDERLFQRLKTGSGARSRMAAAACSTPCSCLIDERYRTFNGTLYQLEPDIKSAPGGLRDIAAARHIRALQPTAFDGEVDRGARPLHEAEDFLQRIRSVLHLETGRDVNVLSHDLQENVAEALGSQRPAARSSRSKR